MGIGSPSMDYGFHFGVRTSPYYIYTPRWIESSAGIRVLHYLCHALNCAGEEAFLILSDVPNRTEPRINPKLKTPILTQEQAIAHFRGKRNPIVVYPETIKGNPLGSTNTVRYLLNYAGLLGGNSNFHPNEYVIAFSANIAKHYQEITNKAAAKVLFVPPVNPSEFEFNVQKKPFQLVYAGKYRSFVGSPSQVGDLPTIEIRRDGKEMQSRSLLKQLLSEASVLYCFENSSLITEAILSGTPVLLVENEFFKSLIAESELGWGGVRFMKDKNALEDATLSIQDGIRSYNESINLFPKSLHDFISESQSHFLENNSSIQSQIRLRKEYYLFFTHKISLGSEILKSKGLLAFTRVVFHYFRKRAGLKKNPGVFDSEIGEI